MADLLKLAALDRADLTVISAQVQDALTRRDRIRFDAKAGRVTVELSRYAWDRQGAMRRLFPKRERRLSALVFDRVTGVRYKGIDAPQSNGVLALLAITFQEGGKDHDPSGTVTLLFAGDAALALDVECIEVRLADTGGVWQAGRRPAHLGDSRDVGDSGASS